MTHDQSSVGSKSRWLARDLTVSNTDGYRTDKTDKTAKLVAWMGLTLPPVGFCRFTVGVLSVLMVLSGVPHTDFQLGSHPAGPAWTACMGFILRFSGRRGDIRGLLDRDYGPQSSLQLNLD